MFKISIFVISVSLAGSVGFGTRTAMSKGQIAQAPAGPTEKSVLPDHENLAEPPTQIYSPIQGPITVMKIREVGAAVKKGEIVCELGTSKLRDQLIDQQIATSSANANSENATLNRKIAEIAVVEYVEGLLASEKAEIRGELRLAEAELELGGSRACGGEGKRPKSEHTVNQAGGSGRTSCQAGPRENPRPPSNRQRLHRSEADKRVRIRTREDPLVREVHQSDIGAGDS